jgi:hypothetical protein
VEAMAGQRGFFDTDERLQWFRLNNTQAFDLA